MQAWSVKKTAFREKVYRAVQRIPCGRVTTYAQVARVVGCGSARAVGQALRVNPFSPEVPCHRVIASDLSLGGFQGQSGGSAIRCKLSLLAQEGVFFDAGKLRDAQRVYCFRTDCS